MKNATHSFAPAPARWAVLAVATLALAGCQSGGYTAKAPEPVVKSPDLVGKSPKELFPATNGTQWVFEATGGTQTQEVTFRVENSQPQGNGTRFDLAIYNGDGQKTDTTRWLVDDRGIFQLAAQNGVAFDPPQLVLPFPIKPQQKFKYDGRGPAFERGNLASIKRESLVRGIEPVDAADGKTYEAVAVETASQVRHGNNNYVGGVTIWFAPNVGIVRFRETVVMVSGQQQAQRQTVLKLKSFSQKR